MSKKPLIEKKYIGVYLGAHTARYPGFEIVYNDIEPGTNPDLCCDMLNVSLTHYDYIIATPPCNYYSHANYRRQSSVYAQATKHLLPDIIYKLVALHKPFVVENVRNKTLFSQAGLFSLNCYVYFIGRHTYWTNIRLDEYELAYLNGIQIFDNIQNVSSSNSTRQGGNNVKEVIRYFIFKAIYQLNRGVKRW